MLRQHTDEGHGGGFVIIDDARGHGLTPHHQIDALAVLTLWS
jgi:hypothetical protein